MSRGVGPYGSLGAEQGAELAGNLRVINPFTLGIFFLYAYDAKNLGGWDDLKGRKIYNGPPRGGALTNARSMIQIVAGLKEGDDYEGIQVNWGQGTTLVTSGEPDAIVLPEVFPGTRLTAITAAGKMTGWSMPKSAYESEAMQKYMVAPGSAPFTIPVAELQATGDVGPSFPKTTPSAALPPLAVTSCTRTWTMTSSTTSSPPTSRRWTISRQRRHNTVSLIAGDVVTTRSYTCSCTRWREAGYDMDDCAVARTDFTILLQAVFSLREGAACSAL